MGEFYHLKKYWCGVTCAIDRMPEGFWANKGHWRGRFWTMGGKNSAGWLFPAVEDRFPLRNVHVVETRIRGIHEKSEKCHHIWNLKNYIKHSVHGDMWLHWHQPSTALVISASQNINWVDKRGRYGGNFLFICFVRCILFLTSTFDCFDQEKLVAHHLLYL